MLVWNLELGSWEERKLESVSAAYQLCDLEKVICFSEPCFFICQMGTVIRHGWHEKANGMMELRHWQLPWQLLNEAGGSGKRSWGRN